MPSTTWTTDLTTATNPATLAEIRLCLTRNGHNIPHRDADVVAKYLRIAIDASNRRNGLLMPVTFTRPQVAGQPTAFGFERDAARRRGVLGQQQSASRRLAHGALGLLVMLALYVAFAG